MAFRIIDCEQNSEAWLAERAGLVTCSELHTVLASGKGGGESKTRATYMKKIAGAIITGQPPENYKNAYMDRGHLMEDEARANYAFLHNYDPVRVGFIRNDTLRVGYSPDSLIGEGGLLEIKTLAPHLLIDWLDAKDNLSTWFPSEHLAQCQGGLWVSEREWIDLIGYFTGMEMFEQRLYRDEIYIAKLATEVKRFNDELDAMVERRTKYKRAA